MVLPAYTWVLEVYSLELEGCASSLEHRLGGRRPRRAPHAKVDFRSLVELQSPEVYCDVLRGVVYPWSRDLVRSTTRDGASLLCETERLVFGDCEPFKNSEALESLFGTVSPLRAWKLSRTY
ncbi:hypothetical protein BHE74_00003181 [Ensete ventricosum]|nr:hypothetical protein BHE74_00003181 [Ensete ventricosum]